MTTRVERTAAVQVVTYLRICPLLPVIIPLPYTMNNNHGDPGMQFAGGLIVFFCCVVAFAAAICLRGCEHRPILRDRVTERTLAQ